MDLSLVPLPYSGGEVVQANIALMRNGIRKIDGRGRYVDTDTHNNISRQLEAELKERFEMEMSEEEREQLKAVMLGQLGMALFNGPTKEKNT